MMVNKLSLNFNGPSLCQDLIVNDSTACSGSLHLAGYSVYGVHQSITLVADCSRITVGILCEIWPSWVF